ncbi:hypothetical protein ASPZODRAFT_2037064 [Penicilliopsis zonata CBS 506.65]|uniref:Enoyl reductase (ER) domain-containing protein n=1 Tax=Penicilliopsis zonata CBS 506.65 TaxID=1073090 RepID=A0A1L9SG65_9EURO|nr:hypothetical protein ASPZODRAFT_2037064 [Penicilliopsis zonata CBS 506.65]OJJ46024.1 hypothetical protein ASPZODRAFT_2037064 [Penicilliopsis zonata CBS 506.65]
MTDNKALIYKSVPHGYPVPGKDLTIEERPFDAAAPPPPKGITVQLMYSSFDPYLRQKMRDPRVASYSDAFELDAPVVSGSIARVLKSDNARFQPGDIVMERLPLQRFLALREDQLQKVKLLDDPFGVGDVRLFLGALGMPGLTAYSSLYDIGKPKRGETIFVSAASGAVGQFVGQLAKLEGLRVIGSVGSDEKLEYILNELGFDAGFNYKKETPAAALARLAPQGLDIYFENVGGAHLEAALDRMNQFGRLIFSGMVSQYNITEPSYPIRNLGQVVGKRLTIRGFIVGDDNMGPLYAKEHQERVAPMIKDGRFKVLMHETDGIENAAEGLVGIFYGKNMGKAVLKW